ncbi:MAG: hypothetical protein JNK14_07705 [Chitinophagaceae bacterium]|nr:hypothetical protein [Chitinophagaceae bacterium]
MKNYLFGLLALVLAIGFSSFTVDNKNKNAPFEVYEWYEVTYDGQYESTGAATSNLVFSAQTKNYAESNDGCSGSGRHCLRGFLSTNIPASFPSTDTPDETTPKN